MTDLPLEFQPASAPRTLTRLEHIILEAKEARENAPLDDIQLTYWKQISNNPEAVQKLLDRSETYQAMLRARGVR